MIKQFKSRAALDLYKQGRTLDVNGPPQQLWERTLLLLRYLDVTDNIRDLNALPMIQLTPMARKTGGYSLRVGVVNGVEWRLGFTWKNSEAHEVDLYRQG